MSYANRIYLTPMPVRIWHWINALGIVTLSLSGAQIRFPEYFHVFGSYKSAIWLHNTAGIVVTMIYFLWFIYYAFVAKKLIKLYVPTPADLSKGIMNQSMYYFYHFFLGGKNPHTSSPDTKFNPMQKVTYMALMFAIVPFICVSGILLLNIAPLRDFILMIGGIKILIGLHYLVGAGLSAFVIAHIYLATLGPTPVEHFKPMWHGWEDHHSHE